MSPCPTLSRRTMLAAALSLTAGAAWSQPATAWPTQAVKILVGFPGGSTPDTAARVLAEVLAKMWGQPVVVENRPGASGNIAADQVAKARDDHTLGVVINGNLTTAKRLNPRLPFDPARDFSFLSLLATAPLALVAPVAQPAGTAFFQAARAAGSQWSYGSVGLGSVSHLGMELIKSRASIGGTVHVPYNGNPAVITALLGGQVQMGLMPPGIALPHVQAGKLRIVGVTGARSTLAPDLELLSALGVAVDELEVWNALVGPAALGRAAQERLARDVPEALRQPEVRQRFLAGGWQALGSPAAALQKRVDSETRLLGGIIDAQGIRLE